MEFGLSLQLALLYNPTKNKLAKPHFLSCDVFTLSIRVLCKHVYAFDLDFSAFETKLQVFFTIGTFCVSFFSSVLEKIGFPKAVSSSLSSTSDSSGELVSDSLSSGCE